MGYTDDYNYQWYNVAGWGNTSNCVEQAYKGSRGAIAPQKNFAVEPNRWYDLQVEVDGDSLCCYVDGLLDVCSRLKKGLMMEGVFVSTTIDEANNIMYVKVVNLGEGFAPGEINLSNCNIDYSASEAVTLTRLASANGTDENTLDNPKAIYPATTVLKAKRNKVSFDVAPFSINIVRIKLQ